jgi:hypothetical protein
MAQTAPKCVRWYALIGIVLWLPLSPLGAVDSTASSRLADSEVAELEKIQVLLQQYVTDLDEYSAQLKDNSLRSDVADHPKWLLSQLKKVISGEISPALFRLLLYGKQNIFGKGRFFTKPAAYESRIRDELKTWRRRLYDQTLGIKRQTLQRPPGDVHHASIPRGEIQQIQIKFRSSSWGRPSYSFYELNNVGQYFEANNGRKISSQQIDTLQDSFSGLRLWDYEVWCSAMSDYNREVNIVVKYADHNNDLLLNSYSTCPDFVPWNITWRGNVYLRFGAAITNNLMQLIADINGETTYEPRSFDWGDYEHFVGFVPAKNAVFGPGRSFFVEEDFLQTLYQAPVFRPYLLDNAVVNMHARCMLGKTNPECNDIVLWVWLLSHDNRVVQKVPVLIRDNQLVKVQVPPMKVIRATHKTQHTHQTRLNIKPLGLNDESIIYVNYRD